ncbi:hypothetical protein ACFXB4_05880 [Streptomyces lavendulae]|uniref:hypothetical protein n=1 Tax=Streptomyces lavendulae TaxID=1914 RepID=UPI0024A40CFB|nr:hypothetical protein Sros01_67280 [Streptomyces roseochromogenus]
MNAVQIAGYWVPAREPVREAAPDPLREPVPRAAGHPVPPLTTLLRRRAAWGLAVARGRTVRHHR